MTNGIKSPVATKWWHFFFVYPGLVIFFAGSIPTALTGIKAWTLNVAPARVQGVEDQKALWEANIECISEAPVYSTDVSKDMTISVALCPSADILLRYKTVTDISESTSYVWVKYPGHESKRDREARVAQSKGSLKVAGVYYGQSKCVGVRAAHVVRILKDDEGCILEVIGLAARLVLSTRRIGCERPCYQVVVS